MHSAVGIVAGLGLDEPLLEYRQEQESFFFSTTCPHRLCGPTQWTMAFFH